MSCSSRKRLLEHSVPCVFVTALYIVDVYPVPGGVLFCPLANGKGQEIGLWFYPVPHAGILRNQLYVVRLVVPGDRIK